MTYTLSQALTDREVSEDELWTDPLVLFEAPIELLTTHVGKPIELLTTHVGKPIDLLTTHVGKPSTNRPPYNPCW